MVKLLYPLYLSLRYKLCVLRLYVIRSLLKKQVSRYHKADKVRESTGASDSHLYPEFCETAAISRLLFYTFKRDSIYNRVMEHDSKQTGLYHLESICTQMFTESDWNMFKRNDMYGNPRVYSYDITTKAGTISVKLSPTTLRYIKTLSDLCCMFDMREISSIVELGAGYGGFARIYCDYLHPVKYYCVDLPEVILLEEAFLTKYPSVNQVDYIDGTRVTYELGSDLFISYAGISDLSRSIQKQYIEKMVAYASNGYIEYWDNDRAVDRMSLNEFVSCIPNARVFQEYNYKNTYLVVWGKDLKPSESWGISYYERKIE